MWNYMQMYCATCLKLAHQRWALVNFRNFLSKVHHFQLLKFNSETREKSKQTTFWNEIGREEMREESDTKYVDL